MTDRAATMTDRALHDDGPRAATMTALRRRRTARLVAGSVETCVAVVWRDGAMRVRVVLAERRRRGDPGRGGDPAPARFLSARAEGIRIDRSPVPARGRTLRVRLALEPERGGRSASESPGRRRRRVRGLPRRWIESPDPRRGLRCRWIESPDPRRGLRCRWIESPDPRRGLLRRWIESPDPRRGLLRRRHRRRVRHQGVWVQKNQIAATRPVAITKAMPAASMSALVGS
jgi:hypothetical protein